MHAFSLFRSLAQAPDRFITPLLRLRPHLMRGARHVDLDQRVQQNGLGLAISQKSDTSQTHREVSLPSGLQRLWLAKARFRTRGRSHWP